MFNRGFSKGHLFHASTEERMSHYRPNHVGINIGTVLQYNDGQVQVKLTDTLYQHDGLRILNEPHDTGLTAVERAHRQRVRRYLRPLRGIGYRSPHRAGRRALQRTHSGGR